MNATDADLRVALEAAGFEPDSNVCGGCLHPGGRHDLSNRCLICGDHFVSMTRDQRWTHGIAELRAAIEAEARSKNGPAAAEARASTSAGTLVCRCGHAHAAGSDGEDAGCSCRDDHDFGTWADTKAVTIRGRSHRVAPSVAYDEGDEGDL